MFLLEWQYFITKPTVDLESVQDNLENRQNLSLIELFDNNISVYLSNIFKQKSLRVGGFFVIAIGFEPMTRSLEGCCSIQLSYATNA